VGERKPATVTVIVPDGVAAARLERADNLVKGLGSIEVLTCGTDADRPTGAAADVVDGIEVLLHLDGLIDQAAQREDLQRNLARITKQVAGVEGKLRNDSFVAKAPVEVVQHERDRLAELSTERERVEGLLAALGD
jgi:valyl-tRNA synthetase